MDDLKALRLSIQSDFEATSKIMDQWSERLEQHRTETRRNVQEITDKLEAVTQSMTRLGQRIDQTQADMAEGFRQTFGRMRLLEDRFGKFVGALEQRQSTLEERVEQGFRETDQRLTRLEERQPPAA